jgi:hypothetical protein
MHDRVAWVDGWEIRPRDDGGFGVYDAHGLIAGPFGTKEQAITAASRLPRHAGIFGQRDAGEEPDLDDLPPPI